MGDSMPEKSSQLQTGSKLGLIASDESETKWKLKEFVRNGGLTKIFTLKIELLYLVHSFVSTMAGLILQNLLIDKACRVNLAYSDEVCTNLENNIYTNITSENDAVQDIISEIGIWRPVLENVIPIIFVLFAGSWTDRHGRKPVIIVPIIGFILSQVGLTISSLFPQLDAQLTTLTYSIPLGLFGNAAAISMAVNSYAADMSDASSMTIRIALVTISNLVGLGMGYSLGGIIERPIGFTGLFGMCACLETLCLIYTIFFIQDKPREIKTTRKKNCLSDIFDLENVRCSFRTIFKKREGNKRIKLILLMFIAFLLTWPMIGEANVMYLFLRNRVNWSIIEYGACSTYSLCMMLLASILSVGLLSYKLKVDDALLGIFACASVVTANAVVLCSYEGWQVYIGNTFAMFYGAAMYISTSMPTKLVDMAELGSMNAFRSVMLSIAPIAAQPVYSMVYNLTLATFPGTFLVLTIFSAFVPTIIYIYLYIDSRREKRLAIEATEDSQDISRDIC